MQELQMHPEAAGLRQTLQHL